ncbi:MAG: DUF192 domain-containing protein [Alphaproteobacteria bacterium]|nr:DUF192 domain-containing protein [Alphaproteobacteria bacterium]
MFKFYRILALAILVVISACSDEDKNSATDATVVSENTTANDGYNGAIVSPVEGTAKVSLKLEVADTQEKIYHGLMGRTSIDDDYGLLFDVNIAPKDAQIAFWMKDTLIPLDMLFLDEQGTVFYIYKNAQPNDVTPIIPPKRPRAVLEINAGHSDKYGINVGDMLKADLFGNN